MKLSVNFYNVIFQKWTDDYSTVKPAWLYRPGKNFSNGLERKDRINESKNEICIDSNPN